MLEIGEETDRTTIVVGPLILSALHLTNEEEQ